MAANTEPLTPEAVEALLTATGSINVKTQPDAAVTAILMLHDAIRTLSATVAAKEADAFKAGLETERVYAGEGGWEWFHQPSGRISKTPEEALAAYRQQQEGRGK